MLVGEYGSTYYYRILRVKDCRVSANNLGEVENEFAVCSQAFNFSDFIPCLLNTTKDSVMGGDCFTLLVGLDQPADNWMSSQLLNAKTDRIR